MLSAGERPQPPLSAVDASRAAATMSSLTQPSATMRTAHLKKDQKQHIWVVTGPAGCGKSTVGREISRELGVPFLEGDNFHTKSNKEKMGQGIPLTDADRWDWLISLQEAAKDALSPSQATEREPASGVVVACSALKKKYRDVMRLATYGAPTVQIHFIYLKLDEKALFQRVTKRQAHYMKSDMVQSQLKDLEEPQGEWDAMTVNADASQETIQKEVLDLVMKKINEQQRSNEH